VNTEPLMTLTVVTATPLRLGAGPHGTRTTVPITGGAFEGPRLRGKLIGGADWLTLRSDGVLELDFRVTLETHDGALIHMQSFGLRHGPAAVIEAIGRGEPVDPAAYYFRTQARFDTAAPAYEFLNKLLAVASGDRRPTGPVYSVYELL
jgi:hypothetical protein